MKLAFFIKIGIRLYTISGHHGEKSSYDTNDSFYSEVVWFV